MIIEPAASPLALLLATLDASAQASVERAWFMHVRQLVSESWMRLVENCAALLSETSGAILRQATQAPPEINLLLPLLAELITPAVLLRLHTDDATAISETILLLGDTSLREQTLDALADPSAPDQPLASACDSWVLRVLLPTLPRVSGLSHTDRLMLQNHLAGDGRLRPTTGPNSLWQALSEADAYAARRILSGRAGVPTDFIEEVCRRRDPSTLLSLCWRANCTASEVLAVQTELGGIRPDQALRPEPDGSWPLTAAAMNRHLQDLGHLQDL